MRALFVIAVSMLFAASSNVLVAADRDIDLAARSEAAIRRGDLANGILLLRAAIDLRGSRKPAGDQDKTSPTPEAMAHGQMQFSRLLADRRQIVKYSQAPGFEKLRDWAIRHFA